MGFILGNFFSLTNCQYYRAADAENERTISMEKCYKLHYKYVLHPPKLWPNPYIQKPMQSAADEIEAEQDNQNQNIYF